MYLSFCKSFCDLCALDDIALHLIPTIETLTFPPPPLNIQVIKHKPDFVSAILQRGSVHQKQGSFEQAKDDFAAALKLNPSSEEARAKLAEVAPLDDAFQARPGESGLRYCKIL